MNHIYEKIPGMFNFQDLYSRMVEEAPDSAYFVEVGTFLGKSAAYMAVEIINSKKGIIFDVIDTFQGSPGDIEHGKFVQQRTGDYYSTFLTHVRPVLGVLRPYPMRSIAASDKYASETLDFVYIDAAHDYFSVWQDIKAWLPKVKPGGYIGGHDYRSNCPGVWKAVGEMFGHKKVERIGTSWLVQV